MAANRLLDWVQWSASWKGVDIIKRHVRIRGPYLTWDTVVHDECCTEMNRGDKFFFLFG